MHGVAPDRNQTEEEFEKQKKLSESYEKGVEDLLNRREKLGLQELASIGDTLCINPENSTLWNMRKQIILDWLKHQGETCPTEDRNNLFNNELRFTAVCLSQTPKSYASWFHRKWCLLNMPEPPLQAELDVCKEYLSRDERNFHCWAYWYFLTNEMGFVNAEQCLAFVTEKLIENFSNYSAWHYRSILLSNHPELKLSLTGERELLHNAFFTDPSDQSAWLYHRWILGLTRRPVVPVCVAPRLRDGLKVVDVCFSDAIDASKDLKSNSLGWSPLAPSGNRQRLLGWKCLMTKEAPALELQSRENGIRSFDLSKDQCWTPPQLNIDPEERNELHLLEKLLSMEPKSKWTNLACLFLLQRQGNLRELDEKISTLIKIDPARTNYYLDLRSNFILDCVVRNNVPTCVRLPQGISRLSHTQYFYFVVELDLSGGQLRDLSGIEMCRMLEILNAAKNKISKAPFEIRYCPHLKQCTLTGNPLSIDEQTKLRRACQGLAVKLIF